MKVFSLKIAALVLLISVAPLLSQPAFAQSLQDQRLTQINQALSNLTNLVSPFEQRSETGEIATGTLYLSQNTEGTRRLKIAYEPPTPLLIIAQDDTLIYFDRDLQQTTHVNTADTPAYFLTQTNIDLRQAGDIHHIEGTPQGLAATLILRNPEEPDLTLGTLTLYFSNEPSLRETPLMLSGWQITDPQGLTTRFALINPQTEVAISEETFEFYDPNFYKTLRAPGTEPFLN